MNLFNRAYRRWRLRRICKACGLNLYPHVQEAVINGDTEEIAGWGRRTGKTMTAILCALVDPKKPVPVTMEGIVLMQDPDLWKGGNIGAMFPSGDFIMYYNKCVKAGIKVPEMTIARKINTEDGWKGVRQGNKD